MDDRAIEYHHVQDSPQWVVGLASLAAILVFSFTITLVQSEKGPPWVMLVVVLGSATVYVTVLSATRLTTRVTPTTVELVWRLGWPSKKIDRASIVAATAQRTSRLAGWGIRKIPGGWMWRVWGLETVELELDTGRVFRIGTDDQAGLLAALGR